MVQGGEKEVLVLCEETAQVLYDTVLTRVVPDPDFATGSGRTGYLENFTRSG